MTEVAYNVTSSAALAFEIVDVVIAVITSVIKDRDHVFGRIGVTFRKGVKVEDLEINTLKTS